MTSIVDLICKNPSGLLEMKPSMTIIEYPNSCGFNLKNIHTIFQSKLNRLDNKDWFDHGKESLHGLFTIQAKTEGNLLVVFIVEVMKQGRIYCYLVLSDEAFEKILNDKTQSVLQVHQMYSEYIDINTVVF